MNVGDLVRVKMDFAEAGKIWVREEGVVGIIVDCDGSELYDVMMVKSGDEYTFDKTEVEVIDENR